MVTASATTPNWPGGQEAAAGRDRSDAGPALAVPCSQELKSVTSKKGDGRARPPSGPPPRSKETGAVFGVLALAVLFDRWVSRQVPPWNHERFRSWDPELGRWR